MSSSLFSLEGKNVAVVGAGSGIVRAVAERELKSQQFVAAARRVTLASEAAESDARSGSVYTANSETRS